MDDLAREYLLTALAAGRLQEGVVDAYYGPVELTEVAARRDIGAAELARRAQELRERVAIEATGQRAAWLTAQLVALETILRRLAGEEIDYLDEVELCFQTAPTLTPAADYARVRAELAALLPAGRDLRSRLAQRDESLAIPRERLAEVVEFALADIGARCRRFFPQPTGESLSVSLVSDEPWAAYNWYDGDLHSRIEINTDLPVRVTSLAGLLTHEAYPGHHLEHTWKEQRLVREQGRAEASVQLINTPEALISEGLAELGKQYVLDEGEWQELLLALALRAGIDMSPQRARDEWQIDRALHGLRASGGDAALLLHVEHRPADEIRRWLESEALRTEEQSAKDLEFISHPLWRAYVFCYAGGEALLEAWCSSAGDLAAQRERFFRLLTEQLTPSAVRAEQPVRP
jgi:hypothetical protein